MANVETALLHSAKGPKRSALQGSGRYPLTPAGQTAEEPDAGQGGFLYGLLRYVRSVYAVNGTDGKILTSLEKNDVQIVIPYAPGGGSDNLVRGMMQYLDLGATTVAVNVEGAAGYIGALQGGHIQLEVNSLADTSSYIAAGTNVPLLVCNDERIDACPDVPTTVESGYDVTYGKPRGFFAPKGTDEAVLKYISEKMSEVCQNEDFVKAMSNLGFTVDYVDGAAAKERTIKWAEELKPVFEEMSKITA